MSTSISTMLEPQPIPSKLHIVMFPWFAFGHFTPYLHLSNKLAQRGHKVSFLLPNKAISHLQLQNLHPHLITFHPLTLQAVPGLPPHAETASDLPFSSHTLLAKAFDLTRHQVEALVIKLVPDFIFYDLGCWIPELASSLGVKVVMYNVIAATCVFQTVTTKPTDVKTTTFLDTEFGVGLTFRDRIKTSVYGSDAVCFRTCMEVDGEIVECIKENWKKPFLLTGPDLPEEEESRLDRNWDQWLNTFGPSSKVIYCALGTQIILNKEQFQELVLGFEATGLPFLVILKPPIGCNSIDEALPEGFLERVKERGVVYGDWVQQTLILKHAMIGCFVCHCGYGSMWEGLVSECQIVALPFLRDQVINAKMMAEDMKVAVVVEREDSGWISKERLCDAIKSVMDDESEIGLMIRKNHLKYREVLTKEGFMSNYIDRFIEDLQQLK